MPLLRLVAIPGALLTFSLLGRPRLPAMLVLLGYGGAMALSLDATLAHDLAAMGPRLRRRDGARPSVNGEPASRAHRTVMVVTAGVALWNMGAAYLVGLILYHAAARGVVRL